MYIMLIYICLLKNVGHVGIFAVISYIVRKVAHKVPFRLTLESKGKGKLGFV